MMKRVLYIIVCLLLSNLIYGQPDKNLVVGKVSFVSSQNVYVRFTSTRGISEGDTLYINSENKILPVLIVTGMSSSSCICKPFGNELVPIDHLVLARPGRKAEPSSREKTDTSALVRSDSSLVPDPNSTSETGELKKSRNKTISGSLSANSYSDFSDAGKTGSYRFRYTLAFDVKDIDAKGLSFESYSSFRHTIGEWDQIRNSIFNGLKIYSLALKYDLSPSTRIMAGRRINNRLAGMGPIDGLQGEKSIGKATVGLVAGFRPGFSDFGFNLKLPQFGIYAGFDSKTGTGYSTTTLGLIQQMNGSATDRRFLYFQQSSSFSGIVSFLGSAEIDLFKLVNDKAASEFEVTNLYMSIRYRPGRRFSLSGAYDSRKNVYYYETYKTFTERILENERRQGLRFQADYSIGNNMSLGLTAGTRFMKSDPHHSQNISTFFTWRNITAVRLSSTFTASYIKSGFINGLAASLNIYGDLFDGIIQPGLGYRYIDYTLPESLVDIKHHVAEINLTCQPGAGFLFSVNYEGTFEKDANSGRVYLQLRKRF